MQETSSLRKGNILIVEDERVVALNLQDQLEKLGFQVYGVVASGGGGFAADYGEEARPCAHGHQTERDYGWGRGGSSLTKPI